MNHDITHLPPGPVMLDVAGLNTWFRRFLMRSYFRRYTG